MTPENVEQLLLRLNSIGIALSNENNLDDLLNRIVKEAREFCNAEAGSLYLIEEDGLHFVIMQNEVLFQRKGHFGVNQALSSRVIELSKDRLSGYVGITGEVLNIADAYEIPSDLPYTYNKDFDQANDYRTRSMLLVPMTDPEGKVEGVLQLINAREDQDVVPFDKRWENLVHSLASQAAVAMRNAKLTDQLKKAYRDTIVTLSVAAEFRDHDTAAHLHRMSHYAMVIAEEFGLPPEECEALLFASPMHDVGKIGVPDSILLKPGKLTDEEYAEMQKHTLYGEQILSISNAPILQVSREIAASHHEKWDGTGYPRGIAGEKIPLRGRICALADVFDALTSKRCYKPAFELEKALQIIDQQTGQHFDPDVVAAFHRGIQRILHYRQLFADENLTLGELKTDTVMLIKKQT